MSGQLSTSLFMKVNHQNSKKNGRILYAIETIQKQGDTIDSQSNNNQR